MKVNKKIAGSAMGLLLVTALPAIGFSSFEERYAISEITVSAENGLTLADKSLKGGNLQEKIDSKFGRNYAALHRLVIQEGELTAEDCKFIKQSLTGLAELILEGNANFSKGIVPKNAFADMASLEKVVMVNVKEIGSKAFGGCENLEYMEFPNVEKTGVQAFAQMKGCSTSRLKVAKLPRLKSAEPRMFYYCTNLTDLYLGNPPVLDRPVGKEGLWFERTTKMVIHVPNRKVYDEFMKAENCTSLDWSAFNFTADNGDKLPVVVMAAEYKDADYDFLRNQLLPRFDKTDKTFDGKYYTGDYKVSLNMYTFNTNINAWMTNSNSAPHLSTLDAIKWAAKAGFDAVDVTCYYIPGYSNTDMPTKPESEVLAYARKIKELCARLHIEISGTGIQNNFADANEARRKKDVERIKFWIKAAHEMGAPVIRIFAGPPPADVRREGWEKIAKDRIAPLVREVAMYAKENYPEVRIGLQNHGGMLATANQVIQVLKWVDCDNVGIINDTGFYREFLKTDATKYDWYRDIALVLPYSSNFQIKKKPAGAETDELMDLHRLVRDIRKSPYRGYIPIELLWINKDEGSPNKLTTPPYEETTEFLKRLKQALEDTKNEKETTSCSSMGDGLDFNIRPSHPNIISFDSNTKTLNVLPMTYPYLLNEQLDLVGDAQLKVTGNNGIPRSEIEEIQDNDKLIVFNGKETTACRLHIQRYELINHALNPSPDRIKVSSYGVKCDYTKAFNGISTGTSESGWFLDGSQLRDNKETFWLALDLEEEKDIQAFGVAWGTNVGSLKKRIKDGTYRVLYTNDSKKWEKLSHATEGGKGGLKNYNKPQGWSEVYVQNVNELPDANGNKVFIRSLEQPIKARYVMVSGELASRTIEIYNFFVFQRKLVDGAEEKPIYPTSDLLRIQPDYTGMAIMPGRPAVIKQGTQTPVYHLTARENVTVTGTLFSPEGKVLYTSSPISIQKGETHRLETAVSAKNLGTYCMQFAVKGHKSVYDSYYFTAIDEEIGRYTYENPYPAIFMRNNRLVYVPDYKGNTVIDYSNVGYKGGGVAIPNVPIRVTLTPSTDNNSDDTERIQNAVDMLSRMPLDANGFRGAILLKAGTYRISKSILIARSGIVIKGEGDGHESVKRHDKPLSATNWFDYAQSEEPEKRVTKVVATWIADSYNKSVAMFNFSGGNIECGEPIEIADQYVPAGTRTIRLQDVGALQAGDNILITRAVNAAWAQDLKMDVITDAPAVLSANQWAENGTIAKAYTEVTQERTISHVDLQSKTITLTEPVVDPLNMKYGVSTVTPFSSAKRVQQAGIENIQLISRFNKASAAENNAFGVNYKSYDDEYHAQVGVRVGAAENIWIRRVTNYHIDVAVNISGGSRWVTVQDVNCLEPVGGVGGERRYSFTNSGGTLVLNQRNYTRYTRHGFIIMGHVMGPNVFYNDRSDYQFDANEPHLRWSAGGLFDNMKGRIYVQNRWNNGTAHGWAGANYTLYNSEGKFIISQSPLAANYLFGQSSADDRLPFVMAEVDPGNVPNFKAYEYSVGKKMEPHSLYLQQLKDRMGEEAVNHINNSDIPAYIDKSVNFDEVFAYLSDIRVDGKKLEEFKKEVLEYTIPIALDYKSLPEIKAVGMKGATVERNENNKGVTFTVTQKGKVANVYTITYGYVSKERITSSHGNKQLDKLTDGSTKTLWSQAGSPYVQFYLGDAPVEIEKVSFGYGRNTQIRRQYYFDFEISDDGYTWKKVENPAWQADNLKRGHVMGMLVQPGVGSKKSDYETFVFPKGIKARLLRIQMYGCRNGQGSGSSSANAYWAIDVVIK